MYQCIIVSFVFTLLSHGGLGESPSRRWHLLSSTPPPPPNLKPPPIVDQLYCDVPTLKSHRVCLDSLRVVSPGERRWRNEPGKDPVTRRESPVRTRLPLRAVVGQRINTMVYANERHAGFQSHNRTKVEPQPAWRKIEYRLSTPRWWVGVCGKDTGGWK